MKDLNISILRFSSVWERGKWTVAYLSLKIAWLGSTLEIIGNFTICRSRICCLGDLGNEKNKIAIAPFLVQWR
ncbi:hypothetical protein PL11201_130145 [Planktothrix sp. PCC 11201]|nr:hypothetical protein PL11201_130145 [Planktothrix sp. PCC 11201]